LRENEILYMAESGDHATDDKRACSHRLHNIVGATAIASEVQLYAQVCDDVVNSFACTCIRETAAIPVSLRYSVLTGSENRSRYL